MWTSMAGRQTDCHPSSTVEEKKKMEFFTENHWNKIPASWQFVLERLSQDELCRLLLDDRVDPICYPAVWPLSLLAFKATSAALTLPRWPALGGSLEFNGDGSQSRLLGHAFRRHVKPKKQHEICRLGQIVKDLCDDLGCREVVDIGSGQGHLSRYMAAELDLTVTAVEADPQLVAMATKFDQQLAETHRKKVGPVAIKLPRHVVGHVESDASWEEFASMVWPEDKGHNSLQSLEHLHIDGLSVKRSSGMHGPRGRKDRQVSETFPSADDETKTDALTHPVSLQHAVDTGALNGLPGRKGGAGIDEVRNRVSGLGSEGRQADDVRGGRAQNGGFVLTGLHACGDLSVTTLRLFAQCPTARALTSISCCYMKLSTRFQPHPPGTAESLGRTHKIYGFPLSGWLASQHPDPGRLLTYKARELACHAREAYGRRARKQGATPRAHVYRAALELELRRRAPPSAARLSVPGWAMAQKMSFEKYAEEVLRRLQPGKADGLEASTEGSETGDERWCVGDAAKAAAQEGGRVAAFFALCLLLAPPAESLLLLDRSLWLHEQGLDNVLVPVFNPLLSPRNLVLIASKGKTLE
uniref:methyltransferase-like protein 25B isoform X2 n=1 Tax=Myxine glutinosa TaxID=7769 RepID=UPI00358E213E